MDVQGRSRSIFVGRKLVVITTLWPLRRVGSATARSEREWMALWCSWCTFMIYLSTVLAQATHTSHVMLLLTRPATSQGTQSHRKTCMLLNGYNEDQSQTTDTRRARRALSSP